MRRVTVAEYALEEVKTRLQQQDAEAGSIRRVKFPYPFQSSYTLLLQKSARRCDVFSWIP